MRGRSADHDCCVLAGQPGSDHALRRRCGRPRAGCRHWSEGRGTRHHAASDTASLRAIDRSDDLIGATVLGPVAKGELLQIANIIKKVGGPGSQEFSFPIEAAFAAGGRLRSSDRVDVIATFGTGTSADTQVIATDVLIAHVDRANASLGSTRDRLVITLAVDGGVDTVRLARAVAVGNVMLIRTTGTTSSVTATIATGALP